MSIDNAVLFSIKPIHVYNICEFGKRIEVRKTIPNLKLPFTGYIYCTKDKSYPLWLGPFGVCKQNIEDDPDYHMNGKIIGSFTCNEIREFVWDDYNHCYDIDDDSLKATCLTQEDLYNYGKGKTLYGICIDNFICYYIPKPLNYLAQTCKSYIDGDKCDDCLYFIDARGYEYDESDCGCGGLKPLHRPPQAWCYVRLNIPLPGCKK